ncbi:hypothetical protein Tco_1324016, partial [Tanacetum coccineum]
IMPPRMTTRSAGRSTAAPRGGRTGRRTSRGSRRTREPRGRGDGQTGEPNDQGVEANEGDQGNNQGNNQNQDGNAVNDNIQGEVRNVIVNNGQRGCSYKKFLACNPKEYDGKGCAIVYTSWIEKMKSVQDMSGCGDDQKVKYTIGSFFGKALTWWNSQIHIRSRETANHVMVGASHAAYTDRFHELARFVPHIVTLENKKIERYIYGLAPQIRRMVAATEPTTIQKAVQKAGTLKDDAIRNGSLKRITKMRGNCTTPKYTNYNFYYPHETPCRACFNCNHIGHLTKDYRVVPRMVNPVNARNPTAAQGACNECGGTDHFKTACPRLNPVQGPEGNCPNQAAANNGGQGYGNNGNPISERAFMIGVEEAHQDPNIVTDIKPSNLGFSYEIEIASGQLVEINKIIRDYKLEIEVRIPLPNGETLRVLRERPEEKELYTTFSTLAGKLRWRGRAWVFDLNKFVLHPSFVEGLIVKGLGPSRGGLPYCAKDSITTQTCELSKVEFDDFLTLYHIPSEYHVILPESNQTIFDAPPGYVRLYTHSFSLENLRLPLTEFFCEVLEYFKVHISRLNPFGCAKLTTFVVMCKAYSCEPSVDLFRGFFNLCQAGKWFTFSKRSENIFLIFFLKSLHVSWVGTSIFSMFKTPLFLPSQLLSEQNKLDSKSFKDKLPLNIKENPMFQHLSRYPTSVRIFLILFFSWMASNLRGNMASNDLQSWNFIYTEDDDDLLFLPKEPSLSFRTGSLSVLVNTKPLKATEELVTQPAEVMADSRESLKPELFVVHPRSVAARIKDRKCNTRGGSSRPPVKRKLAPGSSTSRATHAKTSSLEDDVPYLTVSDD